ncbi:CbtA family protein [Herbaspirillum sp. alder98]|uniref:CbtA family protein n=1 Tax=Herbaspirillum sp. alder98 TaxID=2913096 RepID=UPI001CD859B8|nr:CbtA family protein [Herbaspirillum sp. alder98]MCA1326587.1 CbtA family protein [Herbaspirillum sp. alder98]
MNWTVFRRMASAVVIAGALSGILLSGVQHLQVSKIILQAEEYEKAGEAAHAEAPHSHEAAPVAAVAADAGHAHEHSHDGDEWEPADGAERTAYTVLANVSMAIGFALMLVAAIAVSGRQVSWRSGLLWGVAGYLVFFVAPSLGLPPEVPGTLAAPLHARQWWWVMTAGMTAVGLGAIVYARAWPWKLAGAVLLVVPHIIGAPQPEVHGGLAPEQLARAFIQATALANAVFWLALGGLTGLFYRKFG